MLHRALVEGDGPVGGVVAYGCGYLEGTRQFGIDANLSGRVEVFGDGGSGVTQGANLEHVGVVPTLAEGGV